MVLSDIALIVDCPHSTAPDEGEGYPLIRTPNIGKGRLLLDGVHRVSKEVYDLRNKRIIPQEKDILFAREAPAGNAAIISGGQQVCMGQRTVLIRPDLKKVNPHYLVYYILAPKQQSRLLGYSHGATVGHVNIPDIKNLEINMPELTAQNKIANILMTLDECVENNNKRIKILEQMAENLYKEWFVRFRFPGHEDVEFEGGIPKGWKIKNLFDVANVKYGYAFASDEFCDDKTLYPVVRIRDIQNNKTNTYTAEECDIKYKIKENDILIGMDGIFHMCLWCGGEAYLNQRVVEIESKNANDMCNYLLYFSIFPQVKFWEQTISGTTVAHLGDKHLKKMKVIIPDSRTLGKANGIVTDIMDKLCSLRKSNDNLIKQRDLLLPRLMSGKLEVK